MKQNTLSNLILIAYLLMMIVSLVSAVDLFTLSHPSFAFGWIMSVAIEISIAALLIVNRKVPGIKSVLYVLGFITLFQICANTYSAYIHIENISPFAELFALDEWEVIDQKRMLAFATGGVLPAICLALIYIQNEVREQTETNKTGNKEPEDVQIPSDEDGGEAEDASSPKSHADQPISESESESEEVPTPQQQDEGAKDTDINTESEEQAEIATEQLSETDESNDQSEDIVESEAAVEEPKKRKYTKKSTSKSTSKTAKKTSKKTKTSKSNKKPKASKASKKAEEQTSADEVSVTDVPESDPDSQSQESVAELAERLNDIRRGKHNPVSNGYSMML